MVTGATLVTARAVWTSAAQHGASIADGLHRAMPGNAIGFRVYNDPAIAIAWLLGQGAERIAYIDVDAHHGDGVPKKPIAVFLLDYHEVVRRGVRDLLEAELDTRWWARRALRPRRWPASWRGSYLATYPGPK